MDNRANCCERCSSKHSSCCSKAIQQLSNVTFTVTPQTAGMNPSLLAAPRLSGQHINTAMTSTGTLATATASASGTVTTRTSEQIKTQLTCRSSSVSSLDKNKSTFSSIIPTIGQKLSALIPQDARSSVDKGELNNCCLHTLNGTSSMTACTTEIPIGQFEKQLKKYFKDGKGGVAGDTAKINGQLNEVFVKRLKDIDNSAGGCLKLKLITYQEWVDMLLKINQSVLKNMEDLEAEIAERLNLVQQCMNANYHHLQCQELLKCRRDIDHLIKIIQNAYHNNEWDIRNSLFETLSPSQVLGVKNDTTIKSNQQESDICNINSKSDGDNCSHKKQLCADLKALANEVAEKYDETRILKERIACLENEIQNAQRKIQLKDDVIKELRNDIKCTNKKIYNRNCQGIHLDVITNNMEDRQSVQSSCTMESSELSAFEEDCSHFDSLSLNDEVENKKLKLLENELNDYFQITKECNKQKVDIHGNLLPGIFKKLESEKIEANRKLDSIRRHLNDLESINGDVTDCDSGISSKCEDDPEFRILQSIRNRLNRLNDTNYELLKRIQKLEIENNELATSLKFEKGHSECNNRILKEMADLLCNLTNKEFSYADIYNGKSNNMNPFCDAILQIQNKYEEQEKLLLNSLSTNSKKVDDLNNVILKNERQNYERHQMNEHLKCQIEHLQDTIFEREQRIVELSAMVARITQSSTGMPDGITYENKNIYDNVRVDEMEKKIEHLTNDLNKSVKDQHFLHLETRKLNEELNQSKEKNSNLLTQIQRLSSLLKSQETSRIELACKYEILDKNYEEQSMELKVANNQLNILSESFQLMEQHQNEHNIECTLLRQEVLALKEKESDLMNKLKLMEEKVLQTEKELCTAHDVIKEQENVLHKTEGSHKDLIKRLQEANNEIKQKMASIIEDYKKLEQEYEKQNKICKNNDKLIESFRQWKDAQKTVEDKTLGIFNQYENHIKLLMKEKERFIEEYRDLHEDYNTMMHELSRLKICSLKVSEFNASLRTSAQSLNNRIQIVREVTQRLSEQSCALGDKPVSNSSIIILDTKDETAPRSSNQD